MARAGLGQEEHGHSPTESQDGGTEYGPRCLARDALPRLTLGVIRLQLLRAELANFLIPALQRQLSPRATKRPRQPARKQTRRWAEGSAPECSSPRQGALCITALGCRLAGMAGGRPPGLQACRAPGCPWGWWPSLPAWKEVGSAAVPSPHQLQMGFSAYNSFRAGTPPRSTSAK